MREDKEGRRDGVVNSQRDGVISFNVIFLLLLFLVYLTVLPANLKFYCNGNYLLRLYSAICNLRTSLCVWVLTYLLLHWEYSSIRALHHCALGSFIFLYVSVGFVFGNSHCVHLTFFSSLKSLCHIQHYLPFIYVCALLRVLCLSTGLFFYFSLLIKRLFFVVSYGSYHIIIIKHSHFHPLL